MARHTRHGRREGPRRSRTGSRTRRRLHAVRRIEAILDRAHGRSREDYDRRDPERGPRPRYLDLERNGQLFNRLAALDFEYLLGLPFAADLATLRLLLPQSVHGRAQNGHGFWRDETGTPLVFRDATFDRVLTALEPLDPGLRADLVRKERGRRLERLGRFLLANLHQDELVLEDDGEPLLGVELLRGARVETRGFLQGLLLAGWMDDFDQRQMCMVHHKRTFGGDPLILGGGKTYVVRPERLRAVGIVDPGRGEFTPDDIDSLVEHGVIEPADREYSRPEFEQAYFRLGTGEGVCDDLALLYIGARYGWSAYLGAFLMDAVDTYDKFLWRFRPGGVDGRLAGAIQQAWHERHGQDLVRGVEILDVIRYAAKGNDPSCFLSSSHRRFIQTEVGSRVPTLLNHWSFLEGDPVYDIELGYTRFPSRKFYDIARKRFSVLEIDVPAPTYTRHERRR
ncbi:MAG: hypothetical protein R3D98_12560 [Candidatus Krumholzibacteriia bacterium]